MVPTESFSGDSHPKDGSHRTTSLNTCIDIVTQDQTHGTGIDSRRLTFDGHS